MKVQFTRHALARAKQRGFDRRDADLLRMYGTEIPDRSGTVYLMRKRDVVSALGDLKAEVQRLEKLAGWAGVFAGDDLITVYRASERSHKKLLRRHNRPFSIKHVIERDARYRCR